MLRKMFGVYASETNLVVELTAEVGLQNQEEATTLAPKDDATDWHKASIPEDDSTGVLSVVCVLGRSHIVMGRADNHDDDMGMNVVEHDVGSAYTAVQT